MKSKDLVNWKIVSYAYDILDDTDDLNLNNGKNSYGKGSWASSLRYHNGVYYVSTFAGGTFGHADGVGTNAEFLSMFGIAIDSNGNLYVTEGIDEGTYIRKITPGGVVTTIAGSGTPGFTNGQGTAATFRPGRRRWTAPRAAARSPR